MPRAAPEAVDVDVAGSGPAGCAAALVLARAGARVVMVDPARFPRDKACGDVVGPRGVQVLRDLGIALPGARRTGDIVVIGPTGRRVALPWPCGRGYPALALSVPRRTLDAELREAALVAGARERRARVTAIEDDGRTVLLSDGARILAQFVIGGAIVKCCGSAA